MAERDGETRGRYRFVLQRRRIVRRQRLILMPACHLAGEMQALGTGEIACTVKQRLAAAGNI
nr:hypothetical protein [Cronobacter sakazakii]